MTTAEALDILGVGLGADAAQIRQAYLDLARVWHPDRLAAEPRLFGIAEEKLKQVNLAYEVLRAARPKKSPREWATGTGEGDARRAPGGHAPGPGASPRREPSGYGWSSQTQ